MPNKPFVHLIIPQLFQPLKRWTKGYQFDVKSHYLVKLLQNYHSKQQELLGIHASLFFSIGVSTKAELPVAHFRYQVHCNSLPPKGSLLLCADPAHLVVGMSDITLTDKITDLTFAEANEFIDLLNTHFKQDGLTFIIGSNSQWYLSVAGVETLSTTPIDDVMRKNIAHYQIHSSQRNWQALQNEMQMLLHSAPLNQQREMAGLPSVNSLWLWGGGVPQNIEHSTALVLSDNAISGRMLATAAQCDYQSHLNKQNDDSLGTNQNAMSRFDFSKLPMTKTIIINESLVEPAINDDLDAYKAELESLDEGLIKPLFELWKDKKINIQIDSCDGKRIQPRPTPRWKFWVKAANSLTELDL